MMSGTMNITEEDVDLICEDLYGSSAFVLVEQKERIIEKVKEKVFWSDQTCEQIENIVRDEFNKNDEII